MKWIKCKLILILYQSSSLPDQRARTALLHVIDQAFGALQLSDELLKAENVGVGRLIEKLHKNKELIKILINGGINVNDHADGDKSALLVVCSEVISTNLLTKNTIFAQKITSPILRNQMSQELRQITNEVVQMLIEKGADLNVVGHQNKTPLDIATERKHEAIVEMINSKLAEKTKPNLGNKSPASAVSSPYSPAREVMFRALSQPLLKDSNSEGQQGKH